MYVVMVYHGSDVVMYLPYVFQAVLRQKQQHLECPSVISGRCCVHVARHWRRVSCVSSSGCPLHMATTGEDIIVGPEQHYIFYDPYFFSTIRQNENTEYLLLEYY